MEEYQEISRKSMKGKFDYERCYIDFTYENHRLIVELSQSLILKFEDIAEWRIYNNLTDAEEIPNYLDYIYANPIKKIKPEALTITGYTLRE
jgi:hypothetical protein